MQSPVTTRIWYQSFVDPRIHAPYVERLRAYLAEVAAPGVGYEIHGIMPGDVHLGRISEVRCGLQAVANTVAAERGEFDAVLIGHFQDSGLYEARAAVDVPVVGLGEASMLHACTLGSRIGIVSINPVYIPWHREQVARYGLAERVVEVAAIDASPGGMMRAFDDDAAYQEVREQFVAAARPMVDRGVEVVMSAGGLFALLAAHERDFRVGDAIVVNPTAIAVKQAEAAVALRRSAGIGPSRAGTFAKEPPGAVDELAAATEPPA